MVRERCLEAFYKIVVVSLEPDLATRRGTRMHGRTNITVGWAEVHITVGRQ